MNNLVCGKFLNILSNTIIGVCVGLVVALILTLVLHFTCFREKNMALLYVAMFLVLALCGGFVQYRFFKEKLTDQMPTPQEQTQTTIDTIKDKWQNTNGGFTFEQIKKTQEDDTAPICDDQIIKLDCYDFGSYIVFSYKSGGIYQNALFYKSPNGLIVDGMINMYAKMDKKYKFPWWYYNVNSFQWVDQRQNAPIYDELRQNNSKLNWRKWDNLVSVSRSSAKFLTDLGGFVAGYDKACAYAMKQASVLNGLNATANFIKFGEVELIGTANTGYAKINSFYNYLYQEIQGTQYNSTKLIDANSVLCVPVAESLQSKYPIPENKKAEYDNKEFYGVYKCNVAVELKFLKGGFTLSESDKNKEFFEDLNNDNRYKDKVKVEEVVSKNNYSKLNLSFKDTGNSDLTNLNLLTFPVTMIFTDTESNTTKKVVVDTIAKLNNGVNVLLEKNTNIRYEIRSNGLVFDDHDGTFKLTDGANSLTFNYYYINNFVTASVGLNPIGTIDMSKIDLSINPVKIIIKNEKHTYTFTFDNNSKFETKISQMVELGEYEYAILSDTLVFASTSGKLTITTTDRDMLFNCAMVDSSVHSFALSFLEKREGQKGVYCELDTNFEDLIVDKFGSMTNVKAKMFIYTADGVLTSTFEKSMRSLGLTFNSSTPYWEKGNYTAQVMVYTENSTLRLFSNVASFVIDTDITSTNPVAVWFGLTK